MAIHTGGQHVSNATSPTRRNARTELLPFEGRRLEYTYDFGDNWRHLITLEKILPASSGSRRVRCTGGRRAMPFAEHRLPSRARTGSNPCARRDSTPLPSTARPWTGNWPPRSRGGPGPPRRPDRPRPPPTGGAAPAERSTTTCGAATTRPPAPPLEAAGRHLRTRDKAPAKRLRRSATKVGSRRRR
ncbi:hypothetical protein [Embleya sp. NPDC050493]|uniref:IS1096 element passenger TnpR family protein n=1 Tax=Embleya sp. NPDC050493 TaxID=3363989 RepID=UPI0037AB9B89